MWNLKILAPILISFAVGAGACSMRSARDDSSLYVDLSSLRDESAGVRYGLTDAGRGFLGLTVAPPPTAVTGFGCYGVNVTGPGIPETGRGTHDRDPMIDFYETLTVPGNYCAYRGIVTPPIRPTATGEMGAMLQVPPGGVRLVQIVGVNDATVCASGVIDDPEGSVGGNGNRFFEIGRSVLTDLASDRSIDVALDWPASAADQAARAMDCGDGSGACLSESYFDPNANGGTGFGANVWLAQRIASHPGKTLAAVVLNLTVVTIDPITVEIYSSAVGASTPATTTGYQRTYTPSVTGGDAHSFDLGDDNGSGAGLLAMDGAHDYWIVAKGSGSVAANWTGTSGGGGTNVAMASGGGVFTADPGLLGLDYHLQFCGN